MWLTSAAERRHANILKHCFESGFSRDTPPAAPSTGCRRHYSQRTTDRWSSQFYQLMCWEQKEQEPVWPVRPLVCTFIFLLPEELLAVVGRVRLLHLRYPVSGNFPSQRWRKEGGAVPLRSGRSAEGRHLQEETCPVRTRYCHMSNCWMPVLNCRLMGKFSFWSYVNSLKKRRMENASSRSWN